MSITFDVNLYPTSITVYPGKEACSLLSPLLNLFEYEDEYLEKSIILGYILDESEDLLYLNRGVDIEYLRRLLGSAKITKQEPVVAENMIFEYEEVIAPRNEDQRDVINFIAGLNQHSSNKTEHQLFLVKGTGFGKAEPCSRRIPTPTPQGYTLMGDLKVGDYVFDRTGNLTQVLNIFDQGDKDVYKVTFQDGRTSYCCKEHLWYVKNNKHSYDKQPWEILELEQIMQKYKNGVCKYNIPVVEQVNYPKQEVPIDPWLLGYCISNMVSGSDVLKIYVNDISIAKRFVDFGLTISSINGNIYEFCDNNGLVLVKDLFKNITEILTMSDNDKTIPQQYLINDVETRKQLLKGLLFNSSMNKNNNIYYESYYDSNSQNLLNQIKWLLKTFGNNYSLDTINDYGDTTFRLYYTFDTHDTEVTISNIEYSRNEKCRCIVVDNEEQLYLTEDFIVTHNTYCTGVGACLYGEKTLIIVHRDNLKSQWMKSLCDMSGLSSRYVHDISSSEEFEYICDNPDEDYHHDVYIMTHATFRAGLKRVGSFKRASNFSKNLHIGLKIIDEAHLEFRDTLLMDFILNIKRNLYLTATDGRSSKEENAIFKHCFTNTKFYRKQTLSSNQPSKWVNYNEIKINTHLNPNIYRYRVAGGRGMSPASYGKWCIQKDKNKTHIKVCCDIVKQSFEENNNSKVIIFMPLINLCEETAEYIHKKLSNDDSFEYDIKVRTINSNNTKVENERNKQADVIVSTTGSLSTGVDIKGITTIISCSPMTSRIQCAQTWGRIRYGGYGFIGNYYDIVDLSCQMDVLWQKARYKTFKELALNINHYKCELDEESSNTDNK